jgi:outer membrane protein assembly factor BamB
MRLQFFLWLAFFVLGTTRVGQAATAVTLSPASGHPSTVVTVSGTNFGASEAVDVYVDLVDTALLGSSSTGSVSGSVTIPASAAPGQHTITAVGRRTGDFAQKTFNVSTPWTQFGYSAAHSATNSWENTLSPSNVPTIGAKWINPGGGFGASGATVAVNSGIAYVSLEGNGVEALSTATGSVLWSFAAAGTIYASPTVSGGVVYIGGATAGDNGIVYALNATTGAKIWSSVLYGTMSASPAVVNGIVYVIGGNDEMNPDNIVYALNASTGAALWRFLGFSSFATPTVVNGTVYIGNEDGNLYALNASTGTLIWAYRDPLGGFAGTAAVVNGVAYVETDRGSVNAIGTQPLNAGKLLWQRTTGEGGPDASSPAVANNTVFAGTFDGHLLALDAVTGSVDWSVATGAPVRSAAVANGVVYFTSENNIFYAVSAANGEILRRARIGSTLIGSPAVSDGVVYVAPEGGAIYAFSLPPNLNTNAVPRVPIPASLHPDPRLRVSP